jgi:hypothetical protein
MLSLHMSPRDFDLDSGTRRGLILTSSCIISFVALKFWALALGWVYLLVDGGFPRFSTMCDAH